MSITSALREALDLKSSVSFEEFVCSKDYCGSSSMYRFWLNSGKELPSQLNELILDGGIGSGKTNFANYYFAWRVYRLLIEGTPQIQLGLSEDSEIYCFYFSVSLTVAKKAGFRQLYTIFQTCKWFQENAPVNEDLKSSIEFKDKHFHIDYASTEYHAIGLNVWGFILDEANFRQGVGIGVASEYTEVTQMYTQLLDRVISRNANPDGTYNGLAILISSASYQSSFVEQRKHLIKTNPSAKCITSRGYDVRPERYSKERFTVFVGNGSFEAQIIDSAEQQFKLSHELGVPNPDEFFLQVPVSLKPQFEQNIVLALQNHCGVPTMIEGAFMSNTSVLIRSYKALPPYFTTETVVASTEDNTQIIEYFIPTNVVYSERPHSLYLDLSVQHDTGSLVCYRYDGKVNNMDVHTRVFSLRIVPPQYPAQTMISKVRQFIIDLSQYITISSFASDQFQSSGLRQDVCEELGLENIRLSLDSSDIPYLHWYRALVDGRISQSADKFLEQECREAIHDYKRHRIVKAKGSTDDVLQGNVGAFFMSDTYGKQMGLSTEGLYKPSNIVGGRSVTQVLHILGYR